jgi:hypothetical protein
MQNHRTAYPLVQATKGEQHFKGYYDKCPWNASGRYLLAHRIHFGDRMPGPENHADIVRIDVDNGCKTEVIARTRAWNWQQGAMLQWWNGDPENQVIYNDRRDNRFVCVALDLRTGQERVLPKAVGAVSRDGKRGLCLNFARLAAQRPGYGYEGIPDEFADERHSDKDGIYLMDMETGEYRLIVTLGQIVRTEPDKTMDGAMHWFNHLLFSPDDRRFIFLHRWRKPGKSWYTRLYTANTDGSSVYLLNSHTMTSHFDWRDNKHVLAWANRDGIGARYFLFTDGTDKVEVVGEEKLTPLGDGHCSYSPDRRWILTDTYPDRNGFRKLLLYNPSEDRRVDIGEFFSQPYPGPERCDLHPSWSRDGKKICVDSSHSGARQVYIIDVGAVVC